MTVLAKVWAKRFANGCGRFFNPYISRPFATFVVNQTRFWTGVILYYKTGRVIVSRNHSRRKDHPALGSYAFNLDSKLSWDVNVEYIQENKGEFMPKLPEN